jgi:hypothetical protein
MTKHELINDPPPMSLDDFVSVSKLSMCFQVTIALSAPQMTPYVHFSGSARVGRSERGGMEGTCPEVDGEEPGLQQCELAQ